MDDFTEEMKDKLQHYARVFNRSANINRDEID